MQQFTYNRWSGSVDTPAEPLVWTRDARRAQSRALRDKPSTRWTRYERLSFLMMGLAWGLMIAIVAALHFGNYHLETRTSSTSGTHKSFYVEEIATPQNNPSDGEGESQ